MFFNIKQSADDTFTNNYRLNNDFWLNCDAGWEKFTDSDTVVFVKGYADADSLENLIPEIVKNPTPYLDGSFLAVIVNNDLITITHDVYRPTPINIETKDKSIHNFKSQTSTPVWADSYITFDKDFNITYHQFDPIGVIETDYLTEQEVIDQIDEILVNRFSAFLKHNTLPVKWFPSGGIDGCTLDSYLETDYETCFYEHFDLTKFTCRHKYDILEYWGYRQMHHWVDPCVLVTGGNGDENLLRGPETVNLLCMHYGINLEEVLKPTDYHYTHFLNSKNRQIYEFQKNDKLTQFLVTNKEKLFKNIVTRILNDHQHWHLENTLTFTPFKDLKLTKLLLRLKPEDLLRQITDANINKQLIIKHKPHLLDIVSKQKNTNEKENVWKLFKKD